MQVEYSKGLTHNHFLLVVVGNTKEAGKVAAKLLEHDLNFHASVYFHPEGKREGRYHFSIHEAYRSEVEEIFN